MSPKQGMEPCQKHLQARRERQIYILLARGRICTPGCVNKRAGGKKKFVADSGASMHMVSKRDLYSGEVETMKTLRSPTMVMTANGEVQTREEAIAYVKELDLLVTVVLLEETPAVISLGNSARIMGILTTGPAVKNHISPKMAREFN